MTPNPLPSIKGLTPNSERPAERWFLSIQKGSTPENNAFAKLAVEWIDQWLSNMRKAFAGAQK